VSVDQQHKDRVYVSLTLFQQHVVKLFSLRVIKAEEKHRSNRREVNKHNETSEDAMEHRTTNVFTYQISKILVVGDVAWSFIS
jgi:hypothetical protein